MLKLYCICKFFLFKKIDVVRSFNNYLAQKTVNFNNFETSHSHYSHSNALALWFAASRSIVTLSLPALQLLVDCNITVALSCDALQPHSHSHGSATVGHERLGFFSLLRVFVLCSPSRTAIWSPSSFLCLTSTLYHFISLHPSR